MPYSSNVNIKTYKKIDKNHDHAALNSRELLVGRNLIIILKSCTNI